MNEGSFMSSLVDLVIAITVFECIALLTLNRVTGRGLAPSAFLLNLLSGLCLMLAMRGFVHEAGWPWIAVCLMFAGIAHGADLLRRWPGNPARAVGSKELRA